MTTTDAERHWWRSKLAAARERYRVARLEMDEAARAGDWDRVRDLAPGVAREANACAAADRRRSQ